MSSTPPDPYPGQYPPGQTPPGQYAAPTPYGAAPGPYQPGQYGAPPDQYAPSGQYAAPSPYAAQPGEYGGPPAPVNRPYDGAPGFVVPPGYVPGSRAIRRGFGAIGTVIGLIGAAMVLLAFTALTWISIDGEGGISSFNGKFNDLHNLATVGSGQAPGLTKAYFSWLAWVLLVAVVVFVILGNLATNSHALWRILGLLVGIGGAVITLLALKDDDTSWSEVFKYCTWGFWLAIAGFVIAGIGAVVGPRRIRI
jgi:hypothetical protein